MHSFVNNLYLHIFATHWKYYNSHVYLHTLMLQIQYTILKTNKREKMLKARVILTTLKSGKVVLK